MGKIDVLCGAPGRQPKISEADMQAEARPGISQTDQMERMISCPQKVDIAPVTRAVGGSRPDGRVMMEPPAAARGLLTAPAVPGRRADQDRAADPPRPHPTGAGARGEAAIGPDLIGARTASRKDTVIGGRAILIVTASGRETVRIVAVTVVPATGTMIVPPAATDGRMTSGERATAPADMARVKRGRRVVPHRRIAISDRATGLSPRRGVRTGPSGMGAPSPQPAMAGG